MNANDSLELSDMLNSNKILDINQRTPIDPLIREEKVHYFESHLLK